jgi:hypothetical protein
VQPAHRGLQTQRALLPGPCTPMGWAHRRTQVSILDCPSQSSGSQAQGEGIRSANDSERTQQQSSRVGAGTSKVRSRQAAWRVSSTPARTAAVLQHSGRSSQCCAPSENLNASEHPSAGSPRLISSAAAQCSATTDRCAGRARSACGLGLHAQRVNILLCFFWDTATAARAALFPSPPAGCIRTVCLHTLNSFTQGLVHVVLSFND